MSGHISGHISGYNAVPIESLLRILHSKNLYHPTKLTRLFHAISYRNLNILPKGFFEIIQGSFIGFQRRMTFL